MSLDFPYTFVACPCGPYFDSAQTSFHARRLALPVDEDADGASPALNPHDPLSDHQVYPYDRLLFCDECQEIRCPRCYMVEITNWYCPSCLFEVPSSVVKTDGNRCTRNCYDCPICTSPLSINALKQQRGQGQDAAAPTGPFFLSCPYCQWSSLEAGIELSRPTKVTEQLNHLRSSKEDMAAGPRSSPDATDLGGERPDVVYNRLVQFYRDELAELEKGQPKRYGTDRSYSSPASLARLMQSYGGITPAALQKEREKIRPMREALTAGEGLRVTNLTLEGPWASSSRPTTFEQRSSHPWNHHAHNASDLWPVPASLRTKKTKRCRACRHILLRYDDRKTASSSSTNAVTTMKTKIRLLAQNNIPHITLRPFSAGISTTRPVPSAAFALSMAGYDAFSDPARTSLAPGRTTQLLLLVRNPLFEPVRIRLATPGITPGPVSSRVTILCPVFDIGADGDMWDSAMLDSTMTSSSSGAISDRAGRESKSGATVSSTLAGGPGQFESGAVTSVGAEDNVPTPEAGKVWERGRNWVTVVLEVVPGVLPPDAITHQSPDANDDEDDYDTWVATQRCRSDTSAMRTTEQQRSQSGQRNDTSRPDVVEIPVLVRSEWDADASAGLDSPSPSLSAEQTSGIGGAAQKGKVRREVEFWVVLGAGQIQAQTRSACEVRA